MNKNPDLLIIDEDNNLGLSERLIKVIQLLTPQLEFRTIVAPRNTPLSKESLSLYRTSSGVIKLPLSSQKSNQTVREFFGSIVAVRQFRSIDNPLLPKDTAFDITVLRLLSDGVLGGTIPFRMLDTIDKIAMTDAPHLHGSEMTISLSALNKEDVKKLAHYAFAIAESRNIKKISVVAKADAFGKERTIPKVFLETIMPELKNLIQQSKNVETQKIVVSHLQSDDALYQMITNPHELEMMLTMNQDGDNLSSAAAGMLGSIGLCAGYDIGTTRVEETVGGSLPSRPRNSNQNVIFNPLGCYAMLGNFYEKNGYPEAAEIIHTTSNTLLRAGKITRDLKAGSDLSLEHVSFYFLKECRKLQDTKVTV